MFNNLLTTIHCAAFFKDPHSKENKGSMSMNKVAVMISNLESQNDTDKSGEFTPSSIFRISPLNKFIEKRLAVADCLCAKLEVDWGRARGNVF